VNFCIIIPGYNEAARIGSVVTAALRHCPDVVVVDDGSGDATAQAAEQAGAVVLKHGVNKGKGAALETAYRYAEKQGYDFIINMDADGQHDAAEIPAFVEAYRRTGAPVVVGNRMAHADAMPFVRRMTNRFMSWLLSREMGQRVPDTQNGYRLYRRDVLPFLPTESQRFAGESEVLLNLAERGYQIESVPTRVIYGDEKSKIRPVRDTLSFFGMLRRFREERQRGEQP